MNTQGPYYPYPYTGIFGFTSNNFNVPILVGTGGFIEVINTSDFDIVLTLQSFGQVTQESRSKVLYRAVKDVQGTQMMLIDVPQPQNILPGRLVRLPVAYSNGETGFQPLYVNTYEDGEIESYGPVSLSLPPAQSSYYASVAFTGSGNATLLTLPTTATFFSNVPLNQGTCDLLGFDFTSNAGGVHSGSLQISNLNNQPDGSTTLNYELVAPTSGQPFLPLIVRFPTPIPNFLGSQITFSLLGTGMTGTFDLNAYYSLT